MCVKQNSMHAKCARGRHRIPFGILENLSGLRKVDPVNSNFAKGPKTALSPIHWQKCYSPGPITYYLSNHIFKTRVRRVMYKQKPVTPGLSPRPVLVTMAKSPNMPGLRGGKNINLGAFLHPVNKGTKNIRTEP